MANAMALTANGWPRAPTRWRGLPPSGIAVANTYPENGILPMPQLRPNCALCNKSPPGATRAMGAGDTHGKADAMRKRQGATNANGRQAPLRPQKKLTTTSRHPTADAAYRPFGTPKRHVSTCETCRFAARNGTSQKAANLTSQPSASQSVSPSSRQPRPEHRDIDANRQQKPQPNKPCCHTVRPPPVANAHQAKQRKCSCRGTANMTEAPWKHNKNIGTNTGQAFERFWFHTHAAQPVPQWPGGLWHTPI